MGTATSTPLDDETCKTTCGASTLDPNTGTCIVDGSRFCDTNAHQDVLGGTYRPKSVFTNDMCVVDTVDVKSYCGSDTTYNSSSGMCAGNKVDPSSYCGSNTTYNATSLKCEAKDPLGFCSDGTFYSESIGKCAPSIAPAAKSAAAGLLPYSSPVDGLECRAVPLDDEGNIPCKTGDTSVHYVHQESTKGYSGTPDETTELTTWTMCCATSSEARTARARIVNDLCKNNTF